MKRIIVFAVIVMLCAMTSVCAAFSLDRSQWINYANVNDMELFYSEKGIRKLNNNEATVWVCEYYLETGDYRLKLKKYVRGNNKSTILKILDYHSDGTLKQASTKVVPDVGFDLNEEVILRKLW